MGSVTGHNQAHPWLIEIYMYTQGGKFTNTHTFTFTHVSIQTITYTYAHKKRE